MLSDFQTIKVAVGEIYTDVSENSVTDYTIAVSKWDMRLNWPGKSSRRDEEK